MSKITPIFRGFIEKGGKLLIRDKKSLTEHLRAFQEGSEVEVVVRKRIKRRGLDQNGLYWAYLRYLSEETGNDVDTMHELFKSEFIEPERLSMFGLEAEQRKTTTKMSLIEFSEYIKKIETLTGILCEKEKIFY